MLIEPAIRSNVSGLLPKLALGAVSAGLMTLAMLLLTMPQARRIGADLLRGRWKPAEWTW